MQRNTILKIDDLIREEGRPEGRDLLITDYALAKKKAYAKVICQITSESPQISEDWEGYGYGLKDDWALDDVVEEACFAPHQDASSGYVRVSAQGVEDITKEMASLGYQITNWWHSHGGYPVGHSITDDKNFITIAHGLAPSKMHYVEEVQPVEEEGNLYFGNVRLSNIPENVGTVILQKRERNPVAFSLVVNKYGHHYVQRREKDLETGKLYDAEKVGLNVIEDERTFAIQDIERDVRQCLHLLPQFAEKLQLKNQKRLDEFINESFSYLARHKNPKFEKLLHAIAERPVEEVFTTNGNLAMENLDKDSLKEKLYQGLIVSRHTPGYTADAHDLHVALLCRFIGSFAVDDVVKYSKYADSFNEAHKIARSLTRTLCRQAMLPITNGKSDMEDNAKLNYLLSCLNKEERVMVKPRYEGRAANIFLFKDRIRIYKQFFTELVLPAHKRSSCVASLLDYAKDLENEDSPMLRKLYNDTIRQARTD